ncbi:MAG TPA: hypothetical protein VFY90_08805, partial [Tepidiformaceae bacterium]|nr:hypothetical protein [Tepidiformaceae bacterium]
EGVAVISTYPPDVKYVESRYIPAQHEAQEKAIGIWAPEPATASTEGETPSGTQRGNCDPSYPGVCIPPPPPDLDCSDIPYRRFTVVGADPHRFDSDHDGVGCEGG